MSIGGGAWVHEGWGGAGVTEDRGQRTEDRLWSFDNYIQLYSITSENSFTFISPMWKHFSFKRCFLNKVTSKFYMWILYMNKITLKKVQMYFSSLKTSLNHHHLKLCNVKSISNSECIQTQASSDPNLRLLHMAHDFLVQYVWNAQYSVLLWEVVAVGKWDKLWVIPPFPQALLI